MSIRNARMWERHVATNQERLDRLQSSRMPASLKRGRIADAKAQLTMSKRAYTRELATGTKKGDNNIIDYKDMTAKERQHLLSTLGKRKGTATRFIYHNEQSGTLSSGWEYRPTVDGLNTQANNSFTYRKVVNGQEETVWSYEPKDIQSIATVPVRRRAVKQ